MKAFWQPIVVLAALVAAAAACAWPPQPPVERAPAEPATVSLVASLERIRAEVWRAPAAGGEREVTAPTQAGEGDTIRTVKGRALLKWDDLWVQLYDNDAKMKVLDATPTGIHLVLAGGTALHGHRPVPADRVDTVDVGSYAQSKCSGTMVMVSYHPQAQIGLVRVFDGAVSVRGLIGEEKTVIADAGEWVLISPNDPPRVSNRLEAMQVMARELDAWDVFHAVEMDVRNGFGIDANNRVRPSGVKLVFEPPPAAVAAAPAPRPTPTLHVEYFAAPDTIVLGKCTQLHWRIDNAGAAYISGGGRQAAAALPAGDLPVCPTETTVYRLAVDTGTGRQRFEVTVHVTQPPPPEASVECYTDPGTIVLGGCASVYWRTENAGAAFLSGNTVGTVEVALPSGSLQVCPQVTSVYYVDVEAPAGSRRCETTVYVEQPPPAPNIEPPQPAITELPPFVVEPLPLAIVVPHSITISGGGGPLEDWTVQQALLAAIPWAEMRDQVFTGSSADVFVSMPGADRPVNVLQYPYEPQQYATVAMAGLADFNSPLEIWVTTADPTYMALAEWLTQKLGMLDIKVKIMPTETCPFIGEPPAYLCLQ